MAWSRQKLLTSGLLAIALALRLGFCLLPQPPQADAADYLRLARGLRDGNGFVSPDGQATAFRPPVYPLFLAVLGVNQHLATGVQAILGALTCLLAVRLARCLHGTGAAPWIAGLLLAIDPFHAAATARLLSETLFGFLFLLALVLLHERPSRTGLVLAGLVCGLSVLTRTAGLPAVCAVVLYIAWRHPRGWRGALAFGVAVSAVASIWIARNCRAMDAPVLTTQGGITLYSSWRPPQGKILGVLVNDERVRAAEKLGEVRASRALTSAAIHEVLSDPSRALRLVVLKCIFFWLPVDWEIGMPPGQFGPVFLFALPLAVLGYRSHPRECSLALLLLGVLTLFSALVYGSPRLRLPYEPLVHVAAALAITSLRRKWTVCAWAGICGLLFVAGDPVKVMLRAVATNVGLW